MKKSDIKKIYWHLNTELLKKGDVFDTFFERWSVSLREQLSIELSERKLPVSILDNSIFTNYKMSISELSLRILIREIEVSDLSGELQGISGKDRYQYYVRDLLSDVSYLKELYQVYPRLYESILQITQNYVDHILEVLDRFQRDRDEIAEVFFPSHSHSELVSLEMTDSDAHNHGKKVMILHLDHGGVIVYKPRDLKAALLFSELLRWMADSLSISYSWYKMIPKDEYGWCGFVSEKPCQTQEEVRRFYYREGILLCLGYALGTRDLHCENIIASGETPILIDLEACLGRTDEPSAEESRVIYDSVLNTGILPGRFWNMGEKSVNLSGMSQEEQTAPFLVPMVCEAGSAAIHMNYVHPVISIKKNMPTINGQRIEATEYEEQMIAGFQDGYRIIMEHRSECCSRLACFSGTRIRHIVRDTQQYAFMRSLLGFPEYMESMEEQQIFLKKLLGEGNSEQENWIRRQEQIQLMEYDIPCFTYDPDSTDLLAGEEMFEHYFAVSTLNQVMARIGRFCLQDQELQTELIHMSFAAWKRMKELEEEKTIALSAEIIADHILGHAVKKSVHMTWIQLGIQESPQVSYYVKNMGLYLYDGIAGMTLFFQKMAERTANTRYQETAKNLQEQLFAHTEKRDMDDDWNSACSGGYAGEGSLLYTYCLLYQMTGDKHYLDYMDRQSVILFRIIPEDRQYDLLGGNAGAIMAALKAYELTQQDRYLQLAEKAGKQLIKGAVDYGYGYGWVNPASGRALTGMAHGTSGIMLALAKLAYYTEDPEYERVAFQAFQYDQKNYISDRNDYLDLRGETIDLDRLDKGKSMNDHAGEDIARGLQNDLEKDMAWCHGWAGVLLAQKTAMKYVHDEFRTELGKSIHIVLSRQEDRPVKEQQCLCHGNIGNKIIWEYLMGEYGQKRVKQDTLEVFIEIKSSETGNYGLLNGLSGIGLFDMSSLEEMVQLLTME